MITNFFSRAARAKVASLHSLQKPSLLSIGAALGGAREQERKDQRENADHGLAPVCVVDAEYVRSCYRLKHTAP